MMKVTDPIRATRNALISLDELRDHVWRNVRAARYVVIACEPPKRPVVMAVLDVDERPVPEIDTRALTTLLARQFPAEAAALVTDIPSLVSLSMLTLTVTERPVWRRIAETIYGYARTAIRVSDDEVHHALFLTLLESDLPTGAVRVRFNPDQQRYAAASFHQRPDGTGMEVTGSTARDQIDDKHDAELIRFFIDQLARRMLAAGASPEASGEMLIRV